MDRLLVGSLASAVVGLTLLGVLAVRAEPPTVPLDAVADHQGRALCVDATLRQTRVFESGAARLVLVQANHSLPAFALFSPGATTGDRVRACGVLERTSSAFELRIRTSADLRVVRAWSDEVTPLANLTRAPWEFVDQHVATIGRLETESQRDYLSDEGSPTRIRIVAPPRFVAAGELVMAGGLVEFDAEESLFRLRIETLERMNPDAGG